MAVAVTEKLLFFCNHSLEFGGAGHLMVSYLDGTNMKARRKVSVVWKIRM